MLAPARAAFALVPARVDASNQPTQSPIHHTLSNDRPIDWKAGVPPGSRGATSQAIPSSSLLGALASARPQPTTITTRQENKDEGLRLRLVQLAHAREVPPSQPVRFLLCLYMCVRAHVWTD